MATTTTYLFSFEVDHEIDSHPLYSHGKFFYHHMYGQLLHSNMYHMKTCMINHVKRNIFPCTFLKQQLVKLRCHYWESSWDLLASLETFRIFFIFLLIMSSFTDMDHICIRNMIMREAHELDVSLSGKNSHIFCTTCSNGSMGGDMATTTTYVIPFEVDHGLDSYPL